MSQTTPLSTRAFFGINTAFASLTSLLNILCESHYKEEDLASDVLDPLLGDLDSNEVMHLVRPHCLKDYPGYDVKLPINKAMKYCSDFIEQESRRLKNEEQSAINYRIRYSQEVIYETEINETSNPRIGINIGFGNKKEGSIGYSNYSEKQSNTNFQFKM
ncbi:hypothetical protein AB4422_22905 [Vibrio splendidus]